MMDDLKTKMSEGSSLSIAAASFSIYAFEALKKEFESIDELRFIFTSPTFVKDKIRKEKREFFIPKLYRERTLYGSDFEIKLRNKLEQKAIAKECAAWITSNPQLLGLSAFFACKARNNHLVAHVLVQQKRLRHKSPLPHKAA